MYRLTGRGPNEENSFTQPQNIAVREQTIEGIGPGVPAHVPGVFRDGVPREGEMMTRRHGVFDPCQLAWQVDKSCERRRVCIDLPRPLPACLAGESVLAATGACADKTPSPAARGGRSRGIPVSLTRLIHLPDEPGRGRVEWPRVIAGALSFALVMLPNEATFSQTRNSGRIPAPPKATIGLPVQQTLVRPVEFAVVAPDHVFIDFGRAAFAGLQSRFPHADDGRKITVRLGEKLFAPHAIDRRPPGSVRYHAAEVTLKAGQENYIVPLSPKDDRLMPAEIGPVMPFRYVEIENVPATFAKEDIRQVTAHYAFDDRAGDFHCSDDKLNAIWQLSKYSMKATSFGGIFVDGDRERRALRSRRLHQPARLVLHCRRIRLAAPFARVPDRAPDLADGMDHVLSAHRLGPLSLQRRRGEPAEVLRRPESQDADWPGASGRIGCRSERKLARRDCARRFTSRKSATSSTGPPASATTTTCGR